MEQVINKFEQWLRDETEITNELAHGVAAADSIEEIVEAKNAYKVQCARADAIFDAIQLVKEQK